MDRAGSFITSTEMAKVFATVFLFCIGFSRRLFTVVAPHAGTHATALAERGHRDAPMLTAPALIRPSLRHSVSSSAALSLVTVKPRPSRCGANRIRAIVGDNGKRSGALPE
jgi:hypothetical protein